MNFAKNKKAILFWILGIIGLVFSFRYFIYKYTLSRVFENSNQFTVSLEGIKTEKALLKTGEQIQIAYNDAGGDLVFLYFHGNRGRLQYIIDFLKDKSFISPAFPGYAGSGGSPSVENVYQAAQATHDFANKRFAGKNLPQRGTRSTDCPSRNPRTEVRSRRNVITTAPHTD